MGTLITITINQCTVRKKGQVIFSRMAAAAAANSEIQFFSGNNNINKNNYHQN